MVNKCNDKNCDICRKPDGTISKKDLKEFVKDNYFSEKDVLCEFYEDYDLRFIAKLIKDDVRALEQFLVSSGITIIK